MSNDTYSIPDAADITAIPGLEELWEETTGDPRICIAVLDGPVDRSHTSLAEADLTELATLVSGVSDGGPASRHGTHIASVIFGGHDGPVKGITPGCRGLIIPIFKDGTDGSIVACPQIDLARAILQAVQEGAHIINISGGEFSRSGDARPILKNAVETCAKSGVLVVAAAGNEGCDCLHIPGALSSVLAVGAMDSEGEPMQFSNWGEAYRTQGILAPGKNIPGASPGGGIVASSGTSYATPIISGVAALLLSVQIKNGLKPDPQAVREAILNSAAGCDEQLAADCRRVLSGRLNINGALSEIIQGGEFMSDSGEIKGKSRPHAVGNTRYNRQSVTTSSAGVRAAASRGNSFTANLGNKRTVRPNQINPSGCSGGGSNHDECTCGSGEPQLVFALGIIDYDFGTEARRDSIMQNMDPVPNPPPTDEEHEEGNEENEEQEFDPSNPHDPIQFLKYLEKYPYEAASVIWTLNLDGVPIYAIEGQGAYAGNVYLLLRQFLCEQIEGKEWDKDTGCCKDLPPVISNKQYPFPEHRTGGIVERVAIPGYIVGSVTLSTGQAVPVISPALRGMFSWNISELIAKVLSELKYTGGNRQDIEDRIRELLNRVYDEFRNLGIEPYERAMNYIFTNIFSTADSVIKAFDAFMKDLALDTIEVTKSPACRPNSECWDVKLVFFSQSFSLGANVIVKQFRQVYRITVDVSDVVPVTIGNLKSWIIR